MLRHPATLAALVGLAVLTLSSGFGQPQRDPVFVGARVCASCHEGPEMGHQFSNWLLSKHARAYAVLANPAAERIAELSGIPGEPQKAFLCLGCHATAADTEEWERDETFLIQDGVQCEKCHGPGSEYIGAEVMQDHQAALEAGLVIPTQSNCRVCHYEKGSHRRVLDDQKWELETAWLQIAHPTPADGSFAGEPQPSPSLRAPEGPKIVGVKICMSCHDGDAMGFQSSVWRLSSHSLAFARLATPKAYEFARREGLAGEPQSSDACLRCHSTLGSFGAETVPTFSIDEGVGCEACHGPGSEHIDRASSDQMRTPLAGFMTNASDVCSRCHQGAHGKPFDLETALQRVQHPLERPPRPSFPNYKTPLNLALTPDARELFVACEASSSVIVVDVEKRRKVDEIGVGGQPHDVAFRPDGLFAYVSNRLDDTVSVIDVLTRDVVKTVPVGDEPHGLLTDRSGQTLFVLNAAQDSISLLDTSNLREIKRLSASRNPWSLALDPGGDHLLVTSALSRLVGFRQPLVSELTGIRIDSATVRDRMLVPDANLLQGIAWQPQGDFAFFTLTRTKNLIPMTRLLQGWTITNGMGIAWRDGRVDQVLLDEPDMAFPDPADVAFTPEGDLAFVTSSGSDRVAVVDVARLVAMLGEASEDERRKVFPNHMGKPTEFVIKHIPTRHSPRGLLVTPDGTTVFVANALDDSLTVIDVASLEAFERIDLGGPGEITEVRRASGSFTALTSRSSVSFHVTPVIPMGMSTGLPSIFSLTALA